MNCSNFEHKAATMLLKYLRYRYIKMRMLDYLDGELPAKTRRFIARQIDENPLCYQEYIRARQTKQSIERDLSTFGRAEKRQLELIWANIQIELDSDKNANTPDSTRLNTHYSWGYGLATVMLAMILLAPFALDASRVNASVLPQHPLPELALTQTSPAKTEAISPTSVAFAQDTQLQSTDDLSAKLQNTPEPTTPGQ
jgi:hypothetical protein